VQIRHRRPESSGTGRAGTFSEQVAHAQVPSARGGADRASLRAAVVLVVEDDPLARALYRDALGREPGVQRRSVRDLPWAHRPSGPGRRSRLLAKERL
jgi:hypothetical protein